jgi:hypothetical protein
MVDKVNVPAEEGLSPGSEAPKADNTKTVETVVGRPEWLPENFKSVEDFLEAHKELRADHTRKSQELSELKKASTAEEEADKADVQNKTPEENEEKAAKGEQVLPGVDNDFAKEVSDYAWEHGSLTDEHYEKLEAAGYSRDVVDNYMQGQMATANQATTALVEAGGGAEAVQSMFDWAAQNLDESTIEGYNSKFAAGGPDAVMAMEHLRSRYENSGDAPAGRQVSGANMPSGSTSVYQSVAQVQADMSDPRYDSDPAFRQMVAEKLGRSNVL